ncbi:Asp-tRNA(Asn)/Glu-tRNA(Gln) amidotransferase subunit GatC [Candidatus Woesearchaeota archaeon]|nr:Asp-tRNA(Asn)/Glu-tRNA(Gln) amidotransferase subunit GatC [Candidatus Woesearchaeota archaeon]
MEVDKKLLEHVAGLARLKLSEDELNKFLPQLKETLEFFSRLKEIDTGNVKPSFHPVELKNATREDKEEKCLSQDDALSLAEHKKNGYFKGPRAV